jgi:hypothetical protein
LVLDFSTYTYISTPTDTHFWVDYQQSSATCLVIQSSQPIYNSAVGLSGIMVENISTVKVYITTNTYEVVDTELDENTTYAYKIKYRNVSGVWIEYSVQKVVSTLARTPYNFSVSPIESFGKRLYMTVGRFNNDNVDNSAYRFVCIYGGRNNSPWLNSDYGGYEFQTTALIVNSSYTYQVLYKNRDGLITYGNSITKFTLANTPNKPQVSSPELNSLKIKISSTDSNPSHTLYAIYNETENKWVQQDGSLSTSTVWLTYTDWGGENGIVNTGLKPNTTYYYKIKARNGDAVETSFSERSEGVSTLATAPVNFVCSTRTISSLGLFWESGGGEKDFYLWMVEPSTSSNWITQKQWVFNELLPNTSYQVFIKARNNADIETSTSSIIVYTAIETTNKVLVVKKSTDYIVVATTGVFTNLNIGSSALRIIELTSKTTSLWFNQLDYYTTFYNLLPNNKYRFVAQARNAEGYLTIYSTVTEVYILADTPQIVEVVNYSANTVRIKWELAQVGSNTAFRLDKSTDYVRWTTLVDKTTQNMVVETDLDSTTTYYYRLYGYNGDYDLTVPTEKSVYVLDVIPPAKITSFVATTGYKIGEVNLQWVATGDDGYQSDVVNGTVEIMYSTDINFSSYTLLYFTTSYQASSVQTIVVKNLLQKNTYYFKIRVFDESRNGSEFSETKSAVAKFAPSVISCIPQNGSIGVLPDVQPVIVFDTEIDTTSFVSYCKIKSVRNNLCELIDQEVKFDVFTEDKKVLKILPKEQLEKNYVYKIEISTNITDVFGNAVEQKVEVEFETIIDKKENNNYTTSDNELKNEIPENTLPEDVYIVSSKNPIDSPVLVEKQKVLTANEKLELQYDKDKKVVEGKTREIVLYNKDNKVVSGQFSSSVKISIPYKDTDQDGYVDDTKIKEKTLKLYYLDENNNMWIRIPTSVVDTQQMLFLLMYHIFLCIQL